MERRRQQQNGDIILEDGIWKIRWRENATDAHGFWAGRLRKPSWIGPATGPEALTEEEAEQIAWENFLSREEQKDPAPQSALTLADFVANKFVPEHVALKAQSGRTHYQAILKHVLTPEEVDRMFHVDAEKSKAKLKTVADWPYLGHLRLGDTRPDDVQRLMSAALLRGYSTQTVKHIRNVISAIFAHAKKVQCFSGDNPAGQVKLPGMIRKDAHALSLAQANEVLALMRYPEKEMTLILLLTSMNVAEICGLQWRYVNLTEAWSNTTGEPIPPRTIAIRKQWYCSKLARVEPQRRRKNLSIPEPLLPLLRALSQRAKFTGPDDFVLVSRTGRPIHERNILARRLKPIGDSLQMPWLSWHVFRRTHTILAYQLGNTSLASMASPAQSPSDPSSEETDLALLPTGT